MLARTQPTITLQLIDVESGANPLKLRKVFKQKIGKFWIWTFWHDVTTVAVSWFLHDVIRAWETWSSGNLFVLSFETN